MGAIKEHFHEEIIAGQNAAAKGLKNKQILKMEGQSFGQKAVGLDFNPSGNDEVSTAKQTIADAIDQMNNLRNSDVSGGVKRHASTAITMLEDARMRMVKAITCKD
jgi:hypothetical protein